MGKTAERDVAAAEVHAIEELITPFVRTGDVRQPYLGVLTARLSGGPYDIDCVVRSEGLPEGSPAEVRRGLLDRAEQALAAVDAAGWHLVDYPAMELTGTVRYAVVAISGDAVEPARQELISLRFRLSVVRPR